MNRHDSTRTWNKPGTCRPASAGASTWRALRLSERAGKIACTLALLLSVALLGASVAQAQVFNSETAITIVDNAPANPYPSTINVSEVTGTISKVTVQLNGLLHASPDDIDMLLVSPSGRGATLMSDAGGNWGLGGANLTFDDAASDSLPDSTQIADTAFTLPGFSVYKPTDFTDPGPNSSDTFPTLALSEFPGARLAAFNGDNPNGQWQLFIVDDTGGNTGSLTGWSLDIETTPRIISLSASAYSVNEGDFTSFTVTRNTNKGFSTVDVSVSEGTASGGGPDEDFQPRFTTLLFAPWETTKYIFVDTAADLRDEADETVLVSLFNPVGATLRQALATVTIVDNDAPPTLSFVGGTVSERSGPLPFAYLLSAPSDLPISFNVAAANGSAQIGADFSAPATTVSIPARSTSGVISMSLANDGLDEADETLSLTLSAPVNVTLPDVPSVMGVILDDDASPSVSVNDVSIAEGNSGQNTALLTVSLSAASGQSISVDFATSNGTAQAGSDYTSTSGTVAFAPGQTSRTFSVPILGDVSIEADETFGVTLSNAVNASIGDGVGVATIVNDDSAQSLPALSISSASVSEGNSRVSNLAFTVTLSAAPVQPVSVAYATADGSAQAPGDYASTSGTISFAAGVQSQTIVVPIVGDAGVEPDETLALNLSGAVNATVAVASGVGTILNDDVAPVATPTPTLTPAPTPSILLFTPNAGVRTTLVTLVGANFSGATSVRFNGVAAPFTISSANALQARVPLSATTGKISITTPSGTVSSAGVFTVYVPPRVSSFWPALGPVGTVVTVNGTDFANISSVRIGLRAVPFKIVSRTRLTLTVTPGATTGKISVITVGGVGTSATNFRVTPKISRLSPERGPVGTVVLIDGSNLLRVTSVKFNGVAATSVTVVSASRVRAVVPTGARTGRVSVTNADGTATSAGNFIVTGSTSPA